MAEVELEVGGGVVVHEFVGPESGDVVVLTPGGRFGKDYPGVRALATALADGGKRVLLWDRPNCGRSDIQLYGQSESHMRAHTLGLLLDQLGIETVHCAGGSGGARDSIVFTLMRPERVRTLAVWSIVGGPYSTMSLAGVYILNELRTVRAHGVEAVARMSGPAGSWADLCAVNPRNRARLLDVGDEEFERVMSRWLDSYVPKPNETIPGVRDHEFEQIRVPTLIIRGGERDFDHPKRTSIEVHALIRGSRLIDPPWPEDAWEQRAKRARAGEVTGFGYWVAAAAPLLDFFAEGDGST
jgi:2-hydroxy-6-oxonona-2,4-dienedioate hydrolase